MIKTVGDLKQILSKVDDNFKLDVRIMQKIPEEQLNKHYPYPWNMIEGVLEFQDIGWSDKEICIGVYLKEEYTE